MEFIVIGRTLHKGQWQAEDCVMFKEGIRQFEADNRTKTLHGWAGEASGFMICEVSSAAELDELLAVNPLSQMMDWEIHVLTTPEQLISTFDKVEQKIRSMERAA